MKNSLRLILPLLLLAGLLAGCNTTGCTDNRSSLLLAGFYSMSTQSAIALRDVEIGGVGAPRDSLLQSAGETDAEVYLPLRHTATSTSFFIRYLQEDIADLGLADTITLGYTSEPYFASEECGAVYRYHIRSLDYTRLLIDSIGLLDSVINNVNMQKMHIYFHTEEES